MCVDGFRVLGFRAGVRASTLVVFTCPLKGQIADGEQCSLDDIHLIDEKRIEDKARPDKARKSKTRPHNVREDKRR